jgi:hypothetical protein
LDGRQKGTAQASLFSRITPEFPDVLARPPFNRQRLIAPSRARTRINTADILQDVRPAAGALNCGRLAVKQIGHQE